MYARQNLVALAGICGNASAMLHLKTGPMAIRHTTFDHTTFGYTLFGHATSSRKVVHGCDI